MNPAIREQIDFYNEHWRGFSFANPYKMKRCAAILDTVFVTHVAEPRILDLGCGAGWLSAILGLFGPTVGVDLSESAIQSAQERYPHVQFLQADLFDWEFLPDAFDIVVSQEVIEHVEDQARYLHIAWDALRPGGYLILTTPNKSTMMAMPDEQRKTWSTQPIENWLSVAELKHLVSRKFHVLHLHTVIPGLGHSGIYRLFNSTRIENFMMKVGMEDRYDRLRQTLGLGLHTIVLAQKRK